MPPTAVHIAHAAARTKGHPLAALVSLKQSGVVVSRYGQIHRGDKVKIAQQFGLCGLILYTDPADYNQTNPYPKGTRPPSL